MSINDRRTRSEGTTDDPTADAALAKVGAPDLAADFVAAMRALAGITSPPQGERLRLLGSMLAVADLAGLED